MTRRGARGMLLLFLTYSPHQPKTKVSEIKASPISELGRATKGPPVIAITKTSDSTVTCFYSFFHVGLVNRNPRRLVWKPDLKSHRFVERQNPALERHDPPRDTRRIFPFVFSIFSLSVGIQTICTGRPAWRRPGPPNDSTSRRGPNTHRGARGILLLFLSCVSHDPY